MRVKMYENIYPDEKNNLNNEEEEEVVSKNVSPKIVPLKGTSILTVNKSFLYNPIPHLKSRNYNYGKLPLGNSTYNSFLKNSIQNNISYRSINKYSKIKSRKNTEDSVSSALEIPSLTPAPKKIKYKFNLNQIKDKLEGNCIKIKKKLIKIKENSIEGYDFKTSSSSPNYNFNFNKSKFHLMHSNNFKRIEKGNTNERYTKINTLLSKTNINENSVINENEKNCFYSTSYNMKIKINAKKIPQNNIYDCLAIDNFNKTFCNKESIQNNYQNKSLKTSCTSSYLNVLSIPNINNPQSLRSGTETLDKDIKRIDPELTLRVTLPSGFKANNKLKMSIKMQKNVCKL